MAITSAAQKLYTGWQGIYLSTVVKIGYAAVNTPRMNLYVNAFVYNIR
jgi:hypothetical protein